MTTWNFNIAGFFDEPLVVSVDRDTIKFNANCEEIFINDRNRVHLLAFAQRLIFVIAEQSPYLVKKNHLVMSKAAISEVQP